MSMIQRFRSWAQLVSRLSILEGEGSPEGIFKARPTRLYMDITGTTGNILYIKQSGTEKTGWVLV